MLNLQPSSIIIKQYDNDLTHLNQYNAIVKKNQIIITLLNIEQIILQPEIIDIYILQNQQKKKKAYKQINFVNFNLRLFFIFFIFFIIIQYRRIKILSGFIVILAIVSQAIGWTLTSKFEIYYTPSKNCKYYLTGSYICTSSSSSSSSSQPSGYPYSTYPYSTYPYSTYPYSSTSTTRSSTTSSSSSSYSDTSELCGYSDDDCAKAQRISALFIGGTVYQLVYLLFMGLFAGCFYCNSSKMYNCMRCAQIFWIICYFVCIILFFQNSQEVKTLNSTSKNIVNNEVGVASVGLGVLCIFILLLLFGLNYDIHQFIQEQTKVVQEPIIVFQNQQPIYMQTGIYSQTPQVVYQGPQFIQQQPNMMLPKTKPNQYSRNNTNRQQQMYGQQQFFQPPQGQPMHGQQVYGQQGFVQQGYGQQFVQQAQGQPMFVYQQYGQQQINIQQPQDPIIQDQPVQAQPVQQGQPIQEIQIKQ
ncbi:hypothetical protein pb186bvf_017951 [Paramecium bursaria]